jgi:hypothetical protein
MKVLSALAWPGDLREKFLASGGTRMPEPAYNAVDPGATLAAVEEARQSLRPGSVVDDWLLRECDSIATTALMMASVGTPEFHQHSAALYGVPRRPPAPPSRTHRWRADGV